MEIQCGISHKLPNSLISLFLTQFVIFYLPFLMISGRNFLLVGKKTILTWEQDKRKAIWVCLHTLFWFGPLPILAPDSDNSVLKSVPDKTALNNGWNSQDCSWFPCQTNCKVPLKQAKRLSKTSRKTKISRDCRTTLIPLTFIYMHAQFANAGNRKSSKFHCAPKFVERWLANSYHVKMDLQPC